jgi:hypothetical protein
MSLEIFAVYDHLDGHLNKLCLGEGNPDALWEEYAIRPYWPRLTRFAPVDISDRQPKPVTDHDGLTRRLDILKRLDLPALRAEFERAASSLPEYDDTMTVALYPLDSPEVREKQDGVWGNCTWGNIVINIDPLAAGYERWLPYVFAHEYHHNIWGATWFNTRRGELGGGFVNSLLSDGLADSFALSLYPALRPKWLFDMSEETEKRLWREHYAGLVLRPDVDYPKYMFGDESSGIPWCAGYAVGYRIVQCYQRRHPGTTMAALLEARPVDIFAESGYGG